MMKRAVMVVVLAVGMTILAACSSSDSAKKATLGPAEATAVGTELITDYWNTLSCDASDSVTYESLLDPGFQSVLASGPMTKDDVLRALASTCITSTEVKDIVVTAAPDTLVVSYKARRTANGVQGPFNQLVNVFVKNGNEWDGVVSANAGNVPGQ
jgi:ABC-type phosphate/phosphonate transport system substrate-binding protein